MYNGKKVVVVLPAYRAALTLKQTYDEIPFDLVDEVVLVDDKSPDDTVEVARRIGIKHIVIHQKNRGYGGNQKSCYDKALELGGDIVVMLHPDYQYTPKLLASMITLIGNDVYPVVFGSRILGGGALKGGMPMYKYLFNRMLTLTQNMLMGQKLSEYHTGYRAFAGDVLRNVDYEKLSDDFVFDNQIIAQVCWKGYDIAEITCPTKYFEEASSINFSRSVTYGLGVLGVSFRYFLARTGLVPWAILGTRSKG
ncbi:MAG: glycosyltransferase family 2 protein [Flavobacteriales bacterium]|jgi:glycosyltransferase involved in cell wall biosynthesis|nr:MAG: glycosyltransferase family 2 protein [Flavobacteriales bacterium]